MELPCRCTLPHARCEGRLTRISAYYTDDFAKRVCRAILEGMTNWHLHGEMQGNLGIPTRMVARETSCACQEVQHPKSGLKCHWCEMKDEKEKPLGLVGEDIDMEPLTQEEKERALKNIALIHRNSGHGPMEHLVKSLEARNTDPRIVELAKGYRCDVCQEMSRQVPRPRVSLEPLPPKWQVIQADNAHWTHPHSGERCQFSILVDEGCRFRIGKVMCTGEGRGVRAQDLLEFFQESWKPVFGKPDKLRLDPAGPWRSMEVTEYLDRNQIEMETIPAEAHWGISHVERCIQSTKHVMNRLVAQEPQISTKEALAEALRVGNEREVVRGYSPSQHALGRAPDSSGRFHKSVLDEAINRKFSLRATLFMRGGFKLEALRPPPEPGVSPGQPGCWQWKLDKLRRGCIDQGQWCG